MPLTGYSNGEDNCLGFEQCRSREHTLGIFPGGLLVGAEASWATREAGAPAPGPEKVISDPEARSIQWTWRLNTQCSLKGKLMLQQC